MIDVLDHEARTEVRPAPHHPGHHTAVVVLLPLRIFLAAGWLRAASEKLIDPQWWSGDKLRSYVTAQHQTALRSSDRSWTTSSLPAHRRSRSWW